MGLGGTGLLRAGSRREDARAGKSTFTTGTTYLQHNAFRSPGAPSLDELEAQMPKADVVQEHLFDKMHPGIVDHAVYIDETTWRSCAGMDFVFVCMDSGEAKKLIVEKLEEFSVPFIDVGMGVQLNDEMLGRHRAGHDEHAGASATICAAGFRSRTSATTNTTAISRSPI